MEKGYQLKTAPRIDRLVIKGKSVQRGSTIHVHQQLTETGMSPTLKSRSINSPSSLNSPPALLATILKSNSNLGSTSDLNESGETRI